MDRDGVPGDHEGCAGTRVTPPSDCAVGSECSFQLQLYDADDQPARMGSLVAHLALGLNCSCDVGECKYGVGGHSLVPAEADTVSTCERATNMVDNRDGTFTATVPAGWVRAKGSQSFRFFRGEAEFRPRTGAGAGLTKHVRG